MICIMLWHAKNISTYPQPLVKYIISKANSKSALLIIHNSACIGQLA